MTVTMPAKRPRLVNIVSNLFLNPEPMYDQLCRRTPEGLVTHHAPQTRPETNKQTAETRENLHESHACHADKLSILTQRQLEPAPLILNAGFLTDACSVFRGLGEAGLFCGAKNSVVEEKKASCRLNRS